MTSTQIRYFLEVAKEESFSKAAENLFVSHQILSTQIKSLERELGIELINRQNKRRICLTEAGKLLFDAWSKVREIHTKAVLQAEKLQEKEQNSLVIGIQDMRFVRSYVVPLIKKIRNATEKIELEYRLGAPTELFQMLEDERADMLIMISSDLNPQSGYHTAVLKEKALHLVAAMSKKNPLAKKKKISLKDLEGETLLTIGEEYSAQAAKNMQEDLKQYHIQNVTVKSLNGPGAINIAVETGMGVAILFQELLDDSNHEICTFPFAFSNAKNVDMILVWKDSAYDKLAEKIAELSRG